MTASFADFTPTKGRNRSAARDSSKTRDKCSRRRWRHCLRTRTLRGCARDPIAEAECLRLSTTAPTLPSIPRVIVAILALAFLSATPQGVAAAPLGEIVGHIVLTAADGAVLSSPVVRLTVRSATERSATFGWFRAGRVAAPALREVRSMTSRARLHVRFQALLAALARGLDVREIFQQLSVVAAQLVPHDEAQLAVLTDDSSTAR